MVNRYTRLRVRRKLKVRQQSLEKAGDDASKHFERHVVRRWRNLQEVRRFVAGWLILVMLLIVGVYFQGQELSGFYQTDLPSSGGTYREAIYGDISNVNPIFATTLPEKSASKLIFSSLLKYDENSRLIGDLAKSWSLNEDETIYTIELKKDVTWHDGEAVTAEDVVFTYEAIQNPDTRSFLNSSWQDIKIQVKDEFIVTFALPNPFTPFPHSLTEGGILPKHLLGGVEPGQLRGSSFNSDEPVGTGPYELREIIETPDQRKQVFLDSFGQYLEGQPKIDEIVLSAYEDYDRMIELFEKGELAAASGLRTTDREIFENLPESTWHDLPLTNGTYAFFNTNNGFLRNGTIRTALTRATDLESILGVLDDRYLPVNSPLLIGQLGYDENIVQKPYDPLRANKLLTEEGWKKKPNGERRKKGKVLEINMVTQDNNEYLLIADALRAQWEAAGIKLNITVVEDSVIEQSYIVPHNYEVLLFGVTIGQDPDVFAYWHSSQSGVGGFNLSEYDSELADAALEAGRTRSRNALREEKYKPFLEEWTKDSPAVGIYQPGFTFVLQDRLNNFEPFELTDPSDRYNFVHEWQIATKRGDKIN